MSENFSKQLKAATSDAHRRIESQGFAKQLLEGRVPRVVFLNYLKCLAVITSVFERNLATNDDSLLQPFKRLYQDKLAALLHDIQLFSEGPNESDRNSISASLALADKILFPKDNTTAMLLGYLYVFEGSSLGAEILLTHLRENFPDKAPALKYFGFHQGRARESWRLFQLEFDAIEDTGFRHAIEQAAKEAFNGFAQIFESLGHIDQANLTTHITSVNPEAGNHDMPTDPQAIEAAIRAANICFEEFAILQEKFGERGRRFTMSDSCWLVTLLDLEYDMAAAQVNWLKTVLEPRGIPKGMLIRHLQILDGCLSAEYQQAHASFRLSALAEALQ